MEVNVLKVFKLLLWTTITICLYTILVTHSSIVLFGASFIGTIGTIVAIQLNKE